MDNGNWIESAAKPEVQIALLSVSLTSITILLAVSAVFAYIRVKKKAEKVARKEAARLAKEVAELEACRYLQAEMPALMKEHIELGENAESLLDITGDKIAEMNEKDIS